MTDTDRTNKCGCACHVGRAVLCACSPSECATDRTADVEPRWTKYRRTQIAEMADWTPGFDMTGVSVSEADRKAGSPKPGDKIAHNPANHKDRWLVAADYFAANFEPLEALNSSSRLEAMEKALRNIVAMYDGGGHTERLQWERAIDAARALVKEGRAE